MFAQPATQRGMGSVNQCSWMFNVSLSYTIIDFLCYFIRDWLYPCALRLDEITWEARIVMKVQPWFNLRNVLNWKEARELRHTYSDCSNIGNSIFFSFILTFFRCTRLPPRLATSLQCGSGWNCRHTMRSWIQPTCTWFSVEIQYICFWNHRVACERCKERFRVQTAEWKWLRERVVLGIKFNWNANRALCFPSCASGEARTVD